MSEMTGRWADLAVSNEVSRLYQDLAYAERLYLCSADLRRVCKPESHREFRRKTELTS